MSKKTKLDAPVPAQPTKSEKDWEAEDAMKDLMRAEDHKTKPHLMKRVHAIAGRHMKQLKSIKSIQDLKDTYEDKFVKGHKDTGGDIDKDGD